MRALQRHNQPRTSTTQPTAHLGNTAKSALRQHNQQRTSATQPTVHFSQTINCAPQQHNQYHMAVFEIRFSTCFTAFHNIAPRLEYSWAKTLYTPKSKSKGRCQKNKGFGRNLRLAKREISNGGRGGGSPPAVFFLVYTYEDGYFETRSCGGKTYFFHIKLQIQSPETIIFFFLFSALKDNTTAFTLLIKTED